MTDPYTETYEAQLAGYQVRDYKLDGYAFECQRCAAIVSSYKAHDQWHRIVRAICGVDYV